MGKGFNFIGTKTKTSLNIIPGAFFLSHILHLLTFSNISFFRRGNDYTDTYGFNDVHGVLSPSLVKQFKPDVRNCILDGEMMCYNPKYKSFTTKGNKFKNNDNLLNICRDVIFKLIFVLAYNIDVKTLRVGSSHQPCFCVFDILYYNDNVLTDKPLEERLDILSKVFQPLEGIFIYATRHKAKK